MIQSRNMTRKGNLPVLYPLYCRGLNITLAPYWYTCNVLRKLISRSDDKIIFSSSGTFYSSLSVSSLTFIRSLPKIFANILVASR